MEKSSKMKSEEKFHVSNEDYKKWLMDSDKTSRITKISNVSKCLTFRGVPKSQLEKSLIQISKKCEVVIKRLSEKEIEYYTRQRKKADCSGSMKYSKNFKISRKVNNYKRVDGGKTCKNNRQLRIKKKCQELFGDDFGDDLNCEKWNEMGLISPIQRSKNILNNNKAQEDLSKSINPGLVAPNSEKYVVIGSKIDDSKHQGSKLTLNERRAQEDLSKSINPGLVATNSENSVVIGSKMDDSNQRSKPTLNDKRAQENSSKGINPGLVSSNSEKYVVIGSKIDDSKHQGSKLTLNERRAQEDLSKSINPGLVATNSEKSVVIGSKMDDSNQRSKPTLTDRRAQEDSSKSINIGLVSSNSEKLVVIESKMDYSNQTSNPTLNDRRAQEHSSKSINLGLVSTNTEKLVDIESKMDNSRCQRSNPTLNDRRAQEDSLKSINPELVAPFPEKLINIKSKMDSFKHKTVEEESSKPKIGSIRVKSLESLMSENQMIDPKCPEMFFDEYNFYFNGQVESYILKLGEQLYLAVEDLKQKLQRMKRAKQLLSNDLVVEEISRAELSFSNLIEIRGNKFAPLFLKIFESFEKSSRRTLFIALICRILHHAIKFKTENCSTEGNSYIKMAEGVISLMIFNHTKENYFENLQFDSKCFDKCVKHLYPVIFPENLEDVCKMSEISHCGSLSPAASQPISPLPVTGFGELKISKAPLDHLTLKTSNTALTQSNPPGGLHIPQNPTLISKNNLSLSNGTIPQSKPSAGEVLRTSLSQPPNPTLPLRNVTYSQNISAFQNKIPKLTPTSQQIVYKPPSQLNNLFPHYLNKKSENSQSTSKTDTTIQGGNLFLQNSTMYPHQTYSQTCYTVNPCTQSIKAPTQANRPPSTASAKEIGLMQLSNLRSLKRPFQNGNIPITNGPTLPISPHNKPVPTASMSLTVQHIASEAPPQLQNLSQPHFEISKNLHSNPHIFYPQPNLSHVTSANYTVKYPTAYNPTHI